MIDEGHAEDSYWEHPPNLNGLSARELLELPDTAFLSYMTTSRAFRETIYGVAAARAMAYPAAFGNERALDFGCGIGYDAVSLAERGWTVYLVDLHANNRRVARKWLRELDFVAWESEGIPEDKQFSLVNAYGVLHHIEDVEPVVRRLQACVAPGGQFCAMFYTENFVPELNERSDGKREGPYTRGYTLEQIRELLGADWQIVRTEVWNKDKYRAITATRVK